MVICTRKLSNETIPLRHLRIVHSFNASVWIGTSYDRYPPPPPTLTDSRTLDLRETASRLVVETIENALRAGGLALFDERFQIDSSLDWVLGEAVGGELDAVVPLWSKDGHVVFTQPGFVLWNGLADDDRLDGNIGVVYRTETIKGIIGGVSLFYDHDFQIGHSRLGFGVDAQRDGFYGAFNYYHPLSDTQDGREGYVEDALQGMDASLAVESDVTRVGGNVGYWLFQGDEDVKDEWEFSYGLDAGLRLMPGVFLEGRLERHDKKASFGRRASVGLAFRFTLPNLDGKNYGDGGTVSNLYRPVNREKRILYEERVAAPTLPSVSISATSMEITEGGMATVTLTLSEMLEGDATFNLVSGGNATYGTSASDDWNLSVGGTDCDMASESNPCQVMIAQGGTTAQVTFETNMDSTAESPPETATVSVTVDSGSTTLVQEGSRSILNFTIQDPPTISLNYSGNDTIVFSALMTIELSQSLSESVTVNLVGSGSGTYSPTFSLGSGSDWSVAYEVIPAGGMPDGSVPADIAACPGVTGTSCQITIPAGSTIVEVEISVFSQDSGENIILEIDIASAGTTGLVFGTSRQQEVSY